MIAAFLTADVVLPVLCLVFCAWVFYPRFE